MSYEDEMSTNSSWDKLSRKQIKDNKKTKFKHQRDDDELDLSLIPDSYIGNEDLWEELSEELEDLYG